MEIWTVILRLVSSGSPRLKRQSSTLSVSTIQYPGRPSPVCKANQRFTTVCKRKKKCPSIDINANKVLWVIFLNLVSWFFSPFFLAPFWDKQRATQTDAVVIILFAFRLFFLHSSAIVNSERRKETEALFYLILSTYQKSTVRKLANCKQQGKEARLAASSSKTRLQEYFKKGKNPV